MKGARYEEIKHERKIMRAELVLVDVSEPKYFILSLVWNLGLADS